MKTTAVILGIGAIGVVMTLFISHSFAGPGRCGGHKSQQAWVRPSCGRPGHDQIGGRHERMMSLMARLDLTPEQSEELRDAFKTHMTQFVDVAWPMSQAWHRLAKISHDEEADQQAIRSAADQLGDAIADAAVLRSKFHKAIGDILTPEQSQRLKELKQRPHRRHDNPHGRHWPDEGQEDASS